VLKDQSAVAHAEKVLADFKAVDYDVSKWNDAVSAFETKAVSIRFEEARVLSDWCWGRAISWKSDIRDQRWPVWTMGVQMDRVAERKGELQDARRQSRKEGCEGRGTVEHAAETTAESTNTNPQVSAAKETVTKIAAEEKSLSETLSNIKDARPFEDLTVSWIRLGSVAWTLDSGQGFERCCCPWRNPSCRPVAGSFAQRA